MKCPFLRDASVKYCEASAYRKMLLKEATSAGAERCSSPDWGSCPAAKQRLDGPATGDRCPFLHEAQAEFCGAASVTRFIPATPDLLSRCSSDGHLYCEVYLQHADPQGERLPHHAADVPAGHVPTVDGLPVPPELRYAPNHMWVDVSEDGYCHVGIDAFAARVFGAIDRITFVAQRTLNRPIAVLGTNGVDVQMVFPNALHLVTSNVYLRTSPGKLTSDPYGAGWLFECVEPARPGASIGDAAGEGLITGEHAVAWMRDETERLNQFAHERLARTDDSGYACMADGGTVVEGIAAQLDREELIELVSEFFAPQMGWRRSW
jgi:glycine cleavage system H lipoate-binding protein